MMAPNLAPNAEFRAFRGAPLKKRRFWMPPRSSPNLPKVTNDWVVSLSNGTTPPVKDPVPAASPRVRFAITPWNTFLKYCAPAVVVDVTVGVRTNDAVASTVPVQLYSWNGFAERCPAFNEPL